MRSRAQLILPEAQAALGKQVTPELYQSQIEIGTSICHTVADEVGTPLPTGVAADQGFSTLTISLPTSQGYVYAIVLKGSATAKFQGSISSVQSLIGVCSPDVEPNICREPGVGLQDLSYASLPNPVNVSPEQIIQVTVTISFS